MWQGPRQLRTSAEVRGARHLVASPPHARWAPGIVWLFPDEVVLAICQHLDITSLAHASEVCRRTYMLLMSRMVQDHAQRHTVAAPGAGRGMVPSFRRSRIRMAPPSRDASRPLLFL